MIKKALKTAAHNGSKRMRTDAVRDVRVKKLLVNPEQENARRLLNIKK